MSPTCPDTILTIKGNAMSDAIGRDELRSFIERIENLEAEKASIAGDVREVYAEAKGRGFDPKIMRQVVALRKKDAGERREQEEILALYLEALGMLSDTPLGKAAVAREFGAHA
ncbi:Uncharacterized conserved protein, UPF0335 family [Rhizobiales bacterium GAS113]|nr:Uncharacterized conserved protein, UPF0335 family [Rhizobiales bacterium GAS113]